MGTASMELGDTGRPDGEDRRDSGLPYLKDLPQYGFADMPEQQQLWCNDRMAPAIRFSGLFASIGD